MGFDNECIVNIQSLAGEYFCPVCRLLVYPNEGLQAQCTHLYCKPCLTYVVGTTRACPYDGYLVTEADSKPLIESNKALAETIGKIAVHCLYHRSGCQWQGPLSECTSHGSGCAFGNSPVVCNRCGIQIVHRQVQEHAQTCPGVHPQAQQAEGFQGVAAQAAATSTNAEQTQIAKQSGASNSQVQTSQTMSAPQTQAIANSQAHAKTPAAVPTPEQLYQQQYQQYYQQYPGYDPYQQAYQNYYPYQQQAVQQYQQHPPHGLGQHQPQVYSQAQAQVQAQAHLQPPPQVQPPAHPLPQTQPPHSQAQPIQHVQAPVAAQASVNSQHQLHSAVLHPTQMQTQAHPPPHGHPQLQTQPQPNQYAGAQAHPVQPQSQQMQMPQYQHPQPQLQLPQPQIPPHPHPQVHPQPLSLPQPQPQTHMHSQPQAQLPHPHPQLQPPLQLSQPPNINAQPQTQHPQALAVTGNQSYPQPQAHQPIQSGAQHPPQMHAQSGPISQHHVQMPGQYPQPPPQMRPPQSHPPVPNQQRPVLLPPPGQVPNVPSVQQQPIHPHGQQPSHPSQQRPVMQPMQPVPQQHVQHQQGFPAQTSAPVQNQLHPHAHLVQQQQQFMQPQLRPPGPSNPMQQNSLAYMSSQQNVSHGLPPHQSHNYAARPTMANGTQSQPFPQNPGFAAVAQVRPMQFSANQPTANQNYPPRTNNQLHVSSEQHIAQSGLTLKPTGVERQGDHMPERRVADRKDGSPSYRTAQKEPNGLVAASGVGAVSVEVKNLKSETDEQKPTGRDEDYNIQVDMHAKDSGSDLHAARNASAETAIKHMVKAGGDKSRLDSSPASKSVEILAAEHQDATGGSQPEAPKDQAAKSQTSVSGGDCMHPFPPTDQGRHQHMGMNYGPSSHQRSAGAAALQAALPPGPPHHAHVPGQPSNILRPQGPGHLPQPGQTLNPPDHFQPSVMKQPHGAFHHEIASGGIPGPSSAVFGQGPSHFGPPGSFNSHGAVVGRAPPYGPEGKISQQHPVNPVGGDSFSKQRSRHLEGGQPDSHLIGSSERAPFGQSPGVESNVMRMKDGAGIDSSAMVGVRGDRFKRLPEEGLNRFPMEPAWRGDRGEFEDDLKQFPRHPHFETEPTSKFGSYHSSSRLDDRDPHGFSVDAVSRPIDKGPHGWNDAGLKLDPGAAGGPRFYGPGGPNDARPVGPDGNMGRGDFLGPVPGFGRHHMDRSTPRSPGREYPGFPTRDFGGLSGFPHNQSRLDDMEGPRPFGGGPRTFNFPSDPVGNSFHESRFPPLPGHLRRGELDGPGNVRHNDLMGHDILPSHLRRGEFLGTSNLPGPLRYGEPAGFGAFAGHSRMGDLAGPGNFPHRPPFGEPFGGNNSGHPRLGEPGFRSSYSITGGKDPFDNSRKRKSSTMGWCRICKVDCETVEGLDLHSQTREHQKMAMDMVRTIKQQNVKKQKTSNDKSSTEESKSRGSGYEVRGNKP